MKKLNVEKVIKKLRYLRFEVNWNCPWSTCKCIVHPSIDEGGPLQDQCWDEHVVPDCPEAVPLQEGHQEAETDEDHHMDVLEDWKRKGEDYGLPYKYIIAYSHPDQVPPVKNNPVSSGMCPRWIKKW